MRRDFKEKLLNILNGVSSGAVIALVPGALINELMKGMSSFWPGAQDILTMTTLMQNLLAVFAGLCVSYLLKFNLIQSGSVAATAMIASGAFEMKNGHIMLNGSGDVINIALTIFIAATLVKYLTPKLGSYTVLFLPLLVAVFAGGLGQFALPYTKMITGMIGSVVSVLTDFRPLVMGTPKIQMANILRNPKLFVPVVVSAGIAGLVGAIFNITGTANSAGFGSAGLIGPLAAYKNMASGPITIVFLVAIFAGMPLLLGYLMHYIFIQKLTFVKEEDLLVKNE